MKKIKIKNLILAAALAVGLGVTGISATVQAADVLRTHNHDKNEEVEVTTYDTRDNNRFTHTTYITHIPCCSVCHITFPEDATVEIIEEPHDLVFASSGNRWECTHCDYWE